MIGLERVYDKLDAIDSRLDTLVDKQSKYNEVLATLATSVEYHIKRTDLLERQVDKLGEAVAPAVDNVKALKKVIAWIAGIATLATALKHLL